MTMRADGPSESVHESRGGVLQLERHPGGLLVARVQGHFGLELLPPYIDALECLLPSGRAVGFHDWMNMVDYDTECRKALTDWALVNRRRIHRVHILVKHRLVAMGVRTGSFLVGGDLVRTYWDPAKFERRLNRELQNVELAALDELGPL